MPDGMGVELLLVAGLVALVAIAAFVGVRTRRRGEPPEVGRADSASYERVATGDAATATIEAEAPTAEAAAPAPVPGPAPEKLPLRDRLARSRRFLSERIAAALGGGPDEDTWDDLEAALIQADVGTEIATQLTEAVRDKSRGEGLDAARLQDLLAQEAVALFDRDSSRGLELSSEGVTVWIVLGVNGTGKTTTIGKLAADLAGRGRSVALAAADTFRAAADEQLGVWAERAGAHLVKHQPGADPGAVAYDAFQFARARDLDVLIVDTAGRLHTKTPLMDELAKVKRVLEREKPVDEVLLVIDASTGQNGLVQAREFAETAGVTGIALTKLDGTAKGGIAISIERTLGIPIKLIGVGEGIDDLEPFDPESFVTALLRG